MSTLFDRNDYERRQVMLPNSNLSDEDEFLRLKPRHSFEILDNGGTPFIVDVYAKHLEIFEDYPNFRPKKIFSTPFQKLFVGDNYFNLKNHGKRAGNSLLVQLGAQEYLFIGTEIYKFNARKGDTIQAYASPVGNSAVSYPYAIGKKYVYYMLDHTTLPIEILKRPTSGYMEYYDLFYKPNAGTSFRVKMLYSVK
jgi:hypothetical protein